MVIKDCTVTVSNNTAKIDEEIYLYKNDKNIELTLNIVNSKYKYTYSELDNLIASTKAAYAQVKFKNGDIEIDFDIQETKSGAVKLLISEELIDEDTELGDYSIQIRLFDSDRNSVITLPPIENCIHIKRPLFDNSNVVFDNSNMINEAKINLATLTTEAPLEVTDSNGNYVKTVWKDKDKITDAKMNKIESGIYQNSAQLNNIANKKIDNITLDNNVLTLLANSKTIKTITLPSTGGSGSNAREIELQASTDYIQWRYVGDTNWTNLIALSDLKGSDGRGIVSIENTSGMDLDMEYTITYTDGTTSKFYVTNGEKGDKGDTGATPNLEIGTVETLASGSSATASITGTTENPLLNLGIPKGADGASGTGGSSEKEWEKIIETSELTEDTAYFLFTQTDDGETLDNFEYFKLFIKLIGGTSETTYGYLRVCINNHNSPANTGNHCGQISGGCGYGSKFRYDVVDLDFSLEGYVFSKFITGSERGFNNAMNSSAFCMASISSISSIEISNMAASLGAGSQVTIYAKRK